MQYSLQQKRRRSPSLILPQPERLPCVGVAFIEAHKHSNFCCEFYLVYCKFYLCFSFFWYLSFDCNFSLSYTYTHNFWFSVL